MGLEHKISGGSKYPDKTFYVLRRFDEHVGIASDIIVYLGQLKHMESKSNQMIPVIDMKNYPSDISETKGDLGNAWEDFFVQPNIAWGGIR